MKTRQQQLLQYAALSSAFLIVNNTNAQVEYHEFDPYLPLTNAHDVFIDVDDDGVDDFSFYFAKDWVNSSSSYNGDVFQFRATQNAENEVMVITMPSVEFYSSSMMLYCSLPEALGVMQIEENTVIDMFADWGKADIMAQVDKCGFYGGLGEQGDWQLTGVTRDYFVGFRINTPIAKYGWMRLRHNDFGEVDFVKDFYLNETAGPGLVTPDLFNHVAPAPDNLNLFYNAEGKLTLTFDAAIHEDSLEEYRVILRNTIFTSEFTATKCEITLPENYIAVHKTGISNYTVDLSDLNTDWVGGVLEEGDGMVAYVYGKFDYPITLLNGLSPVSNELEKHAVEIAVLEDENNQYQIWQYDNMLHIKSTNSNIQQIIINDILGRVVFNETTDLIQNEIHIPYQFNEGIYIISLLTSDGIISNQIKL